MGKYKVEITGINTSELKVLTQEEMTELFKKYKEGMELLNKCNTMLDKVEKQIVIIDDNGVVDNNE